MQVLISGAAYVWYTTIIPDVQYISSNMYVYVIGMVGHYKKDVINFLVFYRLRAYSVYLGKVIDI